MNAVIRVNTMDWHLANDRKSILRKGVSPLLTMLDIFPGGPRVFDKFFGTSFKGLGFGQLQLLNANLFSFCEHWLDATRPRVTKALGFFSRF